MSSPLSASSSHLNVACALIAKGRGDSFYIWATQPERTAEEVADETWQEIGTLDGITLYQVDRADFAAGRRPIELIGRSNRGEAIARTELGPWRR